MLNFIVDNLAGILPKEKTVLEIFKERIKRAIENKHKMSFHVAVGFFFFEGFQKLYPEVKKMCGKGEKDE